MQKKSEVISVSLPKKTVETLQRAVEEMQYMSRSEFVRDAVRAFLKEKQHIDSISGKVEGVIIILYGHTAATQVSDVRHSYIEMFRSFMHSDFDIDNCSCCEVLMFSGDAKKLRSAFYELKSIKGVEEAHIFVASRQ